jgi:hypothetical protein
MDTAYYLWGMHLGWWFIWTLLLLWIFTSPYALPGQRLGQVSLFAKSSKKPTKKIKLHVEH